MSAHWLDPNWRYVCASSHADASAFRRRQRERIRQAELARKAEAAAEQESARKVRTINQRKTGT